MTARDHLNSYGELLRKEERVREEIDRLRARWTATNITISDMPHNPNSPRDLSDYAARLDELERELADAVCDQALRRDEIKRKIATLDNPTEADILYYRYLCLMRWDDVAAKIKYDRRYTLKKHADALKHYGDYEEAAV